MSDYYAPHPRLLLDRPLVLVGHPASGVDQVGRIVCARTGLAFNDVERSSESMAGASRARVLVERGLPALRALETRALERALRRRPHGVVVVESGPFEDAALRQRTLERARVVYLRRSDESLLARIQRCCAQSPARLPEFLMGPPRSVETLREHLAPREAALCEVPVVVEVRDEHPARVAEQILASLDELLGVERPDREP